MLIVGDQKFRTLVVASALAFGLACSCSGAASAVEPAGAPSSVSGSGPSEAVPLAVTVVENGVEVKISTLARTVGALLDERNESAQSEDYLAPVADEPLVQGMRVVFRQAIPVEIRIGAETRSVRSSAANVGELLAAEHVDVAPGDDVSPARSAPLGANTIVRIASVSTWMANVHQSIAPSIKRRSDPQLPFGTSRVVDRGSPGVRETTIRFVKHGDAAPQKTIVASRILRAARMKIVLQGVGAYQSLAHVAQQGFASAVHFAGSALHMIATAYTAGCYGCSGVTASGLRAGFGIIAVDPSIIPLGTRLFIPGYGRAIAGDTGGAIHGHRIDLGFNSDGQALQWGNRAVTVYLLR